MKIKVTAVALFALILTSCGSEEGYPQAVLDTIVSSCVAQGGNEEQCECYSGKLQEKYTFSEFKDLEEKLMARKAVPEFQAWADKILPECMD